MISTSTEGCFDEHIHSIALRRVDARHITNCCCLDVQEEFYHISVRQIYETESKLRLSHELKLASRNKGVITVNIFDDNDESNDNRKEPIDLIFCDEESDIDKVEDTLPI
ncbi:hypothetical protein HNY73_011186 [Argiope bruennichi]|uniref:Uncharacterized protein n=1 Tax=Argiope bruennichi TaxID=94029 RepID=A0A8T0F4A1_ARGBR|nr:hypothetical protein HNY73_011186 [Argiope bruennichi]